MSHDRRHYQFPNYHNYIISTVIETLAVGLQSIHLEVIVCLYLSDFEINILSLAMIAPTFLCKKNWCSRKTFSYPLSFKIVKRQVMKSVIRRFHLRWPENRKLPNFARIKVLPLLRKYCLYSGDKYFYVSGEFLILGLFRFQ